MYRFRSLLKASLLVLILSLLNTLQAEAQNAPRGLQAVNSPSLEVKRAQATAIATTSPAQQKTGIADLRKMEETIIKKWKKNNPHVHVISQEDYDQFSPRAKERLNTVAHIVYNNKLRVEDIEAFEASRN